MNRWTLTWLLAPGLLLGACMPLPALRADLELNPPAYRVAPKAIQTNYVTIAGYAEPKTPKQYNRAYYLRYFAAASKPNTVFVLMPGLFAGAADLDLLARQLVASMPETEVWALDRRANALEDRSAMIRSLRTRNPQLAYDYYVKNVGKAGGFIPTEPGALRFTAFWGLEVHLKDLHEVVKRAERAADTVILGGHSLGGSIVSFYSSYDFAKGKTPDPGYAHTDGLLLLDGVLGRTGGFSWQGEGLSIGQIRLIASREDLEAGVGDPFIRNSFDPLSAAKYEVSALLASFAPAELSPGGFVAYPATNRAVAGILNEAQYGLSPVFGVSVGEAEGATFGGNLLAVLLDGAQGVYSSTVTGVKAGSSAVTWRRGNPERDVTELGAFVRSRSLLATNSNEWYFPLRLGLDMIQLGVTLESAPGFVPTREVPTPTLAVGASRGLVQNFEDFSAYGVARGVGAPFTAYILDGFTHADVVAAEVNPVVPLVQQWLERIR